MKSRKNIHGALKRREDEGITIVIHIVYCLPVRFETRSHAGAQSFGDCFGTNGLRRHGI
jgi:hypothetical protein